MFSFKYISQVFKTCITVWALAICMQNIQAQESPKEEDFFKIMKVSSPEGTLLEVGGLALMPNGDLAVATKPSQFTPIL